MRERSFLIAFGMIDSSLAERDPSAALQASAEARAEFQRFLESDTAVTHWWSYIAQVWLVTTTLDVDELTTRVRPIAKGLRFLAVEIDLREANGLLPEQAWEWIAERRKELRQTEPA